MSSGIDYEFRTTLVKNFHTREDIESISTMLKGAKKYCLQKFVDNDNCISSGLSEISKTEAEELQKIAQNHIEKTILRGY